MDFIPTDQALIPTDPLLLLKGDNTVEEYYIRGALSFVSVRKCLGNNAKYWRPSGSDRSGNGCLLHLLSV